MKEQVNSEFVVNILKKAITLRKNTKIEETKFALNLFIEYVRTKLIDQKNLSQLAFINFYNNQLNDRIAGKLETWIEISLKNNNCNSEELRHQISTVEGILSQNLSDSNSNIKNSANYITIPEINIDSKIVNQPIIVPWDFSDVGRFALNHALMYAKATGDKVVLLHVAQSDSDVYDISEKLSKVSESIFKESGIKPKYMVKIGNILKTITQVANENNARLVIMGTHGIIGMQKFTGSLALKVVSGTYNPFIVVQSNPTKHSLNTVLLPIHSKKHCKQRLKQITILSEYFDVKYVLTMPKNISNEQIENRMINNLEYIKTQLTQTDTKYEVCYVNGTNSCSDAALKYAKENKPDMMIIFTSQNINIQDYVLGSDEQKLIANIHKIPVMCVNSRTSGTPKNP